MALHRWPALLGLQRSLRRISHTVATRELPVLFQHCCRRFARGQG
jgi:hypothetical protein